MKALRSLFVFGVLACLSSNTACEVQDCSDEDEDEGVCIQGKSVKTFEGQPITKSVPYVSGQLLNIDSVHGEIDVKLGAAGQISVTFRPFNTRAYDAETQAHEQLKQLVTDVSSDANNVVVKTTRGKAREVGANIEILLPPEFNGPILAKHHAGGTYGGGDIDFDFVGTAPSIDINNDSLIGACLVSGTTATTSTKIRCNDNTTVRGVSDHLDIHVKGIGDAKVQVSLAAVSDTAPDSVIATEDAEIVAQFPATGNFTVNSETKQGTISERDVPGTCQVAGSGLNKSLTCGTGAAKYRLAAGQDAVGDSNVTIDFQ